MASLTVRDVVVIGLTRWEKLGAVRGDVRFPRSAVTSVSTARDVFAPVRGIRLVGTGIPGVVALGTRWVGHGVRDFVAVHAHDAGSVVIGLAGQPYTRVVVSVADPEAVAASLRR